MAAATNKTVMISQSIYDQFPDMLPDVGTMHKKWVWKDDINCLEQVNTGNQATTDKQLLAFSKNKKQHRHTLRKIHFQGQQRKKLDPKHEKTNALSPKPSLKVHGSEKRAVTLQDVKSVALDFLSESGELPEAFQESLRNNQFDVFLAATLYYFDMYFKRIALDSKPKTFAAEPSTAEKKAATSALKKIDLARKLLAEKYCALILGLETRETHHMACGSHRKSFTKKDRIFYETLYSYCCLVIWVTFRRRNLDPIQKEMGRLFRSDSFNPYEEPVSKNEFQLASDLANKEIHEVTLGQPSIRKNKRPPISTIINQRSPVLVSLLPTPKDRGAHLLDRRQTIFNHVKKDKEEEELTANINPITLSVGIIGEMISGFNPFTLAPFGDDAEEDEEGEESRGPVTGEQGVDEKPMHASPSEYNE
ncbi:protein phosphatase 1 regulatory subunit 36-like isoform X2 [Clytia hemisphaerica]|uniref:protein phosphatase 1 regulatory subunit 36-like isoform X2 n=1 Tax=Clytia hemisphaerica TaxID=252671 RepID=UPI0034D54B06